jgi:hypothetical protein
VERPWESLLGRFIRESVKRKGLIWTKSVIVQYVGSLIGIILYALSVKRPFFVKGFVSMDLLL